MRALDEAPFVDVFSPDFEGAAVAVVDEMRPRSGVVRTPLGAMVIRRDLVGELLSDRRLRSAIPDIVRMQGVTDGPIHDLIGESLLAKEGTEHGRLRKLVNRSFTPRAVDPHRPVMRRILGGLLAPLADRGRVELMAEVADHYPIQVMCALLGVPEEDHDRFTAWNKAITWVLSFELGTHLGGGELDVGLELEEPVALAIRDVHHERLERHDLPEVPRTRGSRLALLAVPGVGLLVGGDVGQVDAELGVEVDAVADPGRRRRFGGLGV